jgi:hypothetical protein
MNRPGRIDFRSDEVEWLLAHLLLACRTISKVGPCDSTDRLHRCIDKLDRARFVNGVAVLITEDAVNVGIKTLRKLLRRKRS